VEGADVDRRRVSGRVRKSCLEENKKSRDIYEEEKEWRDNSLEFLLFFFASSCLRAFAFLRSRTRHRTHTQIERKQRFAVMPI
jgi:hypothetical protein